MAHVTLIRPPVVAPIDTVNQQVGTPPLGLAYLAGSLKSQGHEITSIDALGEDVHRITRLANINVRDIQIYGINMDAIISKIPGDTDLIGVSCMFSNEWLYARHLINKIRVNFPHVPIIAGGEHITAESYRSMLSTPALTACALGEGEETIVDLVRTLVKGKDLSEVHGIAYFDESGSYRKTERRLRIKEVDDIPLPCWDGIPLHNYLDAGLGNGTLQKRAMPMLASRGCPYQCTFCSSPSMWGIRWISRNPQLVVAEIKSYIRQFNINHVDFNDLTTVINREWIIAFCKLLISEDLGITWSMSSGTRSEALDYEVLSYMKKAGVERVTYAPESGSIKTLERIQKKVRPARMAKSIRSSVRVGIFSKANFIFGLPDQTKYEVLESIGFVTKLCFLGMYDIAITHFVPYPGSHLFESLVRDGKLKTNEAYEEFLLENVSTKVTGMKSWSKYIPDWSMPLWVIGTIAYFYALQYIIRPHRLFGSCLRLLKGKPVSNTEATIYSLYIKFFKRRATKVTDVEHLERIDLPVLRTPRRESNDPAILINSGNPARGLI
jgi:anaerobic magnesium-protoporphyrin IX monomethyl ester cyclase